MAVDEPTAALLKQLAETGVKPLDQMTPAEGRAFLASMRPQDVDLPAMEEVQDRRIRVTGGVVPIRLLRPRENPDGVIVYYHGGGWVLGTIDDSDLVGRRLAERTGCAVVLVDYRLAPEYRFPTAVDDSYAALCWVSEHVEELAGRRVPIVVAGDSAGGNLSAVMCLKARDAGGPPIAMQVLIYPVTDCDFETTSYRDPENALLLTRESMVWFWDHYAPDPLARTNPDASPLRSGDVARLPPAVVVTAEHDVLRDEGEIYATRLVKAGVPVQQERFAGQMHGFFTMVDVLPGSEAAMTYIADAVRRQLAAS
ncbi:MAG: alpha/beta hydrolase [Acidimicrobiaceae bacterium]|nr:alpha/beta hydrolase [Acidimicrobiaceae bacterium]